jgi:predicted flap endonuclease-1-like 5' DNA nuclease
MSNQFDNIIEGQKKIMDFWSNLSQQMTSAYKPQSTPAEAGQELMQDWYNKQQAFFQEAMKTDPQQALEKAPEHMQKYMEMQSEFTKKWADFFGKNADKMGMPFPNMDNFNSYANPTQYFQDGMGHWKKWMEDGSKWMNAQVMDKMPFNMRPHFTNYLDTYNFLSRYWEPLQRLIKNGMYDKNMVEQYFSADAYEKLINQMMGFRPVGNTSDVVENVNKWFEKYMHFAKGQEQDWSSVSDVWKNKMSEYFTGGKVPFFEMASELNQRLQDQLAPFNNIASQGRQTEISKLIQDIQFQYIAFILKSAEMQAKVYEAGQFALPDTVRDFAEKFKQEQEMPDFQAFFKQYVDTLEEALLEVLHSSEYSKLQSEVSATATQMNHQSKRITELMYADMPFLTHSEADDIAKETSTLRTKVRNLEHRLAEMEKALLLSGKPAVEKAASSQGKGSKKKLMDKIGSASASDADDLKQIKGVGPKLEKMLNELGIYTLKQVSKMGPAEYDTIDELLGAFQGRAKRDNWAAQAKQLM